MYTILNFSICGISGRRVTRNDPNEQINEKDASLSKFSSPIFELLAASNSDASNSDAFSIATESAEEKRKKKREKEGTFRRWENAPSMTFGVEIIEIVGSRRIRL